MYTIMILFYVYELSYQLIILNIYNVIN